MFDALEQILRIAARYRDEGKLQIMTMNDGAEWILDGMSGADRGSEPYLHEEWVE